MRNAFFSVLVFWILLLNTECSVAETRRVTSLADSGPGTLREALATDGPADIIFEVEGDIFLKSPLQLIGNKISLDANNAPGKEIRIVGFGIHISGSEFSVKNLRIWVGDRVNNANISSEQDGILLRGTESRPVKGGSILNCTIFGAVDEGIATYGPVRNIDIGRNMILWGLSKSHHKDVVNSTETNPDKNHHSMATLFSEGAESIRFIQNLILCNRHRNPRIMPGASVGFVNNVVYGWGSGADDALYIANTKNVRKNLLLSFVGNYYQGKKESYFPPRRSISISEGSNNGFGSGFRTKNARYYSVWDTGNLFLDINGEKSPFNPSGKEFISDVKTSLTKADFAALMPQHILSAEEAYTIVLKTAGAYPNARDTLEKLAIEIIESKTGSFIDSPKHLQQIDYPYQDSQ